MYDNAQSSLKGMITGEPNAPVRHTWRQVHERARQVAGGLAAAGVGHADAVAVLAGEPVEIAPTAQGIWMRGSSLTMLHQPTPRTDLQRWAEETTAVINMIDAKAVVVSDPFMAAAPLLVQLGMRVLTIEQLLDSRAIDPVETDDDDVALLQLTSGSTGFPKAVRISHRNVVSNAEAMFVGANVDRESDVIVSWLPCFHDMGMTGYLTVPMYFGVELVKVTPMDFLRDTLLWAKLIDKYRGTMTAAPNFAYTMFAKRLRRQARPGQFDLSTLRWALSGAEQVEPADVEDLCEAGAPFGLRPEAIVPAYGMAETTVAVSFTECGRGLTVDEVDADLLALLHRAIPAIQGQNPATGLGRSSAEGAGGPDRRPDGRRAAHSRRRRDPGARRTCHAGIHDDCRFHRRTGSGGLVRHRGFGLCHRNRQRGGVRSGQRRDHHGRAQRLSDGHRTRRLPACKGSGPAAPSRCACTPGTRAKRSRSPWNPTSGRTRPRCAGSNVRWPTRSSRRSTSGPAT